MKKRDPVAVQVSRVPVKLESLPPELQLRNEVAKRFNVYSYFEDSDSQELRFSHEPRRSSEKDRGNAKVASPIEYKRTREDSPTLQSSHSLDTYFFNRGAMLDDSLFEPEHELPSGVNKSGSATSRGEPNRTLSQEDLRTVLRIWSIETRSRGSEVGESALGRELQKLYPSEVLPPSFYGENDPALTDAGYPFLAGSQELLVSQYNQYFTRVGSGIGGQVGEFFPGDHRDAFGSEALDNENGAPLPLSNPLPLTARYTSLAKWQVGTNKPELQMAHLSVINSITLREGALLRMVDVVKRLDMMYWKYSLLRLRAQSVGLPLNLISLVRVRKGLFEIQRECRVAIAHYRGVTLQVLTDMQVWKKMCRKEVQTDDTVEMLWNGTNYMQKMVSDVQELDMYTVTRLWLKDATTTFMTPAATFPETVLDIAAIEIRALRVKALDVELSQLLERMNLLPKEVIRSRRPPGTGEEEVVGQGAGEESCENPLNPPPDNPEARNDQQIAQGVGGGLGAESEIGRQSQVGSSQITAAATADWESLRDFCTNLWGTALAAPEGSVAYPEIINPSVIECYMGNGYEEVVPKWPLIPSMPQELIDKCKHLAMTIKNELKMIERLAAKAQMSHRLRLQVQQEMNSDRNLLRQADLLEPCGGGKHQLLRKRQETSALLARAPNLLSSLSGALDLSEVFTLTTTHSDAAGAVATHGQQMKVVTPATRFCLLNTNSTSSQALLSVERVHPAQLSSYSYSGAAVAGTFGFDDLALPSQPGPSEGGKVKLGLLQNEFESFPASLPHLNTAKITDDLAKRVVDERTLVEPQPGHASLLKSLRSEVVARKPQDVTKPAWRHKMVVHIQRIVRGFLGRRRFKAKDLERHRRRMATKIQRHWRGIWGRIRFARCLREFRIQFLGFRKQINIEIDSAQTITHFVRYLGDRNVVGHEDAAARSPLFNKKPPNPGVYATYLNSPKRDRKLRGPGGGAQSPLGSHRKSSMSGAETAIPVPALSDKEKEELLKPYRKAYHYKDEANIIKSEVSVEEGKGAPGRSLLSMLDTRNSSRLLLRPRGQLKPFSTRARQFLSSAGASSFSLAGEPNKCYLVPPSLANKEEREALVALLDSSSTVLDAPPTLNLRALLKH